MTFRRISAKESQLIAMWKSSDRMCVKPIFNFNGQTVKQIRNVMSDAYIRAAFIYWEADQSYFLCCNYESDYSEWKNQ